MPVSLLNSLDKIVNQSMVNGDQQQLRSCLSHSIANKTYAKLGYVPKLRPVILVSVFYARYTSEDMVTICVTAVTDYS